MLLLPCPFGLYLWSPGTHVSITGPAHHAKQIAKAAGNFGCPPRARERIVQCIRASGRYDCIVSAAVTKNFLPEFIHIVKRLGGEVVSIPVADFQTERRRP